MTAINVRLVADLFAAGDAALTMTGRGRALEDLIAHVFGSIPGVVVTARNAMNAFASEEIDLAFWNDGDAAGLRFFDSILLVECKNWSSPVGSQELMVFDHKLMTRGRPIGILVAASGITGDPTDKSAAHAVLAQALMRRREILVVTRRELEAISDTDQLVLLLKQKRAQLVVSGTIFEVSAGRAR